MKTNEQDIVKKVWFFDIQDRNLPVIVSYVLWSYKYPVGNDMCHAFTLVDMEEQLDEMERDEDDYGDGEWEREFNIRVANPQSYICLNDKSQKEFMARDKKPSLREGFEEFKQWLKSQGVEENDECIVKLWW